MAIKHGALSAPSGITLTGSLLHEVKTRNEEVATEHFDNQGAFSAGKGYRKKTVFSLSGECLSTISLPTHGSGAGTVSSPRIDSTDMTDKSEGASEFAVEAHYWAAGSGDFA